MLTLYMDESGFTGEDLLNPAQPIFVHVSTILSDEEATALYKDFFFKAQGLELKHKNLSKRPRGQDQIVNFVNAMRGDKKCTVWICHKEFTLLTYLVDLWVEPAMHRDGIDLYKDGGNLALCNMAYYCLRTFQSEEFLNRHLHRFKCMMTERTTANYGKFWEGIYSDYSRTDKRTRDILTFFLGGQMKLGYEGLLEMPERAIDPAFTTAVETCAYWRNCTDEPLALVHDQSSELAKDQWLWDFITSPDIEERTIGPIGRQIKYPLNVSETRFADSRSHLQLQFCDLIAGATAAWCRQFIGAAPKIEYAEQLEKAGIKDLCIGAIWPQPEVDPERIGMKGWSGEGIDFLTREFERLSRKPRQRRK